MTRRGLHLPFQLCAIVLVVLAVSPFTAPFATAEIANVALKTTQPGVAQQFKDASEKSGVAALGPAVDPLAIVALASRRVESPTKPVDPRSPLHPVLRL